MKNRDFNKKLIEYRMTDPIYDYLLELIERDLKENKEDLMILFSIYFSLVSDGNICMSLDGSVLLEKWKTKIIASKVLLKEKTNFDEEEFDFVCNKSYDAINKSLSYISEANLPSLIGERKIFNIDGKWLYLMKYYHARKNVIESIDRIYSVEFNTDVPFDYKEHTVEYFRGKKFELSKGQETGVVEGKKRNLIVTGGPGTGKTTSILFLLLGLLSIDRSYNIYLIAPSGKAASRMKESIIGGFATLTEKFKMENSSLLKVIENLQENTIHRLLSFDPITNGFMYNKYNQFGVKSIFIIDEASMIDICLYDALLSAIPTGARVIMMGDENQLPSVECGAVFANFLKKQSLQNNIVKLDESIRFRSGTPIYNLAKAVNEGTELPVSNDDWKSYEEFEIPTKFDEDGKEIDLSSSNPIYYFKNEDEKLEKKLLQNILTKWSNKYFSHLQDLASNLNSDNYKEVEKVFDEMEKSKILCAENEGIRGIKEINHYIVKKAITKDKGKATNKHYPGEVIMISKNNTNLDLYNGDCGILVKFKKDDTLYLMVQKKSKIINIDGKAEDKIFKLGKFVFYPLRMISEEDYDYAYAITIHKSQGSDYKNILVILPNKKGHALLNRQIVYTAITRTKGSTYILSNQERLEESSQTVITRDTNIA